MYVYCMPVQVYRCLCKHKSMHVSDGVCILVMVYAGARVLHVYVGVFMEVQGIYMYVQVCVVCKYISVCVCKV